MNKYYHVMKKDGAWHLYAGNSAAAIVTDEQQSRVMKTARSLARQHGGRIILHKEPADTAYAPSNASEEPGRAKRA